MSNEENPEQTEEWIEPEPNEEFVELEKLITIRTYDKPIDAHLAKGYLENRGIPAYLADENIISLNPLYANAMGGIKLKIREEDIELAQKFLYESEHAVLTDENEDPVTCPRCSSTEIFYHLTSQKNAGGILAGILSVFFTGYPLYNRDVCKCRKCGLEFEKK